MPHEPLDLEGHYAILRLTPGAGPEEVELAYHAMEEEWREHQDVPRFQIQEAYRVLSDPASKAAYDARRERRVDSAAKTRSLLLGGLIVLLLFIGGFVFPGFLLGDPDPFNAGDVLLNTTGQDIFGTVVRFESSHHFPDATIADAYLIESPDGEQQWHPARDLEPYLRPSGDEAARGLPAGDVPASD